MNIELMWIISVARKKFKLPPEFSRIPIPEIRTRRSPPRQAQRLAVRLAPAKHDDEPRINLHSLGLLVGGTVRGRAWSEYTSSIG